jgi:glycosyltransferase involved in cell wall biosynthesis
VHYLGACAYEELPRLMSHWQVGWMPFAMNEATRFISPTKTPEYLAAGLPVVSSPIRDVVRTWGEEGFVSIASTAQEFTAALTEQLAARAAPSRLARIDRTLTLHSWDALWYRMDDHMQKTSVNAA